METNRFSLRQAAFSSEKAIKTHRIIIRVKRNPDILKLFELLYGIKLPKRTRYEIYQDILKTVKIKGACSITRISYGAGLPVDRTKRFVNFLVSRGLIKKVNIGGRELYRITDRGGEFLQALRTVRKFIQ